MGEFGGLVYVAPDAQRTDARQQSRNMLLSRTARITTQPQLEIYADDVKCSHGATVGQMDAEAIYYMRQRGLSEAAARRLQIEGFVGDIVRRSSFEPLHEAVMELVSEKWKNSDPMFDVERYAGSFRSSPARFTGSRWSTSTAGPRRRNPVR